MKKFFFSLLMSVLTFSSVTLAQQLPTKVNVWESPDLVKTKTGVTRTLFMGSGAVLSRHVLMGHTIRSGKSMRFNSGMLGDELFFIIKYGPVHVKLNGSEKVLDKGSVVFLLPGDEVVFTNKRKDDVELYEMRMRSTIPDAERGRAAGPSFLMDWFDMNYRAHDKGGVRQLFDRKTVMNNRFDIHITSLNPGLSSHAPHTHKNEEIILMVDGEGVMVLGEEKQKIVTGDAAWVESMIPHNITNTGKRPAVYFAIQWN